MPRYEFFCEDCQKPFESILTLAEYEKGDVTCPNCGAKHFHQEAAAFFAVTGHAAAESNLDRDSD